MPGLAGRSGTGPYGGGGTPRIGWTRSAHGIGFPFFVGGYAPFPTPDTRFSWGQILSARGIGFPVWVGADIIRPLCWAPVFS